MIIDGDTGSATEHIAGCLTGAPETTLVGMPTAGREYSWHVMQLEPYKLGAAFGGVPTLWDRPLESREGRPVPPDIMVPVDWRTLQEQGPVVAAMRQRIDSLRAAWQLAGLRGPEREWVPPPAPTAP